jgi:hypothetical protein
MKKIAIIFILCWSAAAGAVPNTINFTGRLSTSAGPVTGAVNLTLKLYDVASGGTPLWTEIHSNVGADNGLVFLDAGTLTTLDEAVFNGNRLYLEIVVGTETLVPRLAINSVPYAMRTAAATSADLLGTSIGPGDVVTAVNAGAGIVAAKTGNAVAVSLSTTGCAAGQAYKFNGTTFACANDLNTTYTGGAGISVSGTTVSLATTGCAAGSVWKFNGTAFVCAPDADTTYTAGTGISVAGTTISLSTTGCAAGSVWKFNGTAFSCQPDANTTYTGTAPISISGTTISLSSAGCAANAFLRWNGTSWVCSSVVTSASCTWTVTTGTVASTSQQAFCPAGSHVISGGCDAAGTTTILFHRPFGPPSNGASETSVTGWNCDFSAAAIGHTSYALCCTAI